MVPKSGGSESCNSNYAFSLLRPFGEGRVEFRISDPKPIVCDSTAQRFGRLFRVSPWKFWRAIHSSLFCTPRPCTSKFATTLTNADKHGLALQLSNDTRQTFPNPMFSKGLLQTPPCRSSLLDGARKVARVVRVMCR